MYSILLNLHNVIVISALNNFQSFIWVSYVVKYAKKFCIQCFTDIFQTKILNLFPQIFIRKFLNIYIS